VHVIPCVRVVECQRTENGMSLLLKVTTPSLGSIRFRFTASDYQGEPDYEDTGQRSRTIKSLLLDTLAPTRADADLDVNLWKEMSPSAVVELISSEESVSTMYIEWMTFALVSHGFSCFVDYRTWRQRGRNARRSQKLATQLHTKQWN
jgi:hypothetical protein